MTEREIFFEALEMATPEARAAYLQGACGRDVTLRRKVDELLKEHFSNDSLLAGSALEGERIAVESPVQEAPAQMIGRYKLLEKIGEGGFGEVWMAEQREPVKRRVALKIIKLGMDSRQIVARFEAERQALAMMDHPNIAKIFDAGTTENPHPASGHPLPSDWRGAGGEGLLQSQIGNRKSEISQGRPYFVMELVRGIKITEYCDQNQLPTQERLRLFILVCQAIQHAHQKGIIHRDIKPSNILVTLHDGVPVPKVIDFGIAKATQQELTDKTVFTQFQQFIGTPAYISPEQAEMSGLDIDTRADIYSLGVLLYELLVGQTPFDAKEMMQGGLDALRQIIREKEPLRPSTKLSQTMVAAEVTRRTAGGAEASASSRRRLQELVHQLQGDLDWIVMKCLEKDRTRRYDTANGLAMDIQRHLENEPVIARPPSAAYKLQKAWQRNKLVFTAVAVVVLALVVGIGVSTWQAIRATAASDSAKKANVAERDQRLAAETERQRAERAEADAVARLHEANLNWVRANRLTGRPGQRFASLAEVARGATRTNRLDLRNEAIACLALPDLRPLKQWARTPRAKSSHWNSFNFSPSFRLYATNDGHGNLTVRDTVTDVVQYELPTQGAPSAPLASAIASPDERFLATSDMAGRAWLWDLRARTARPIDFPRGALLITFTPDSRALVVGHIGSLHFFSSTNGLEQKSIPGPAKVAPFRFNSTGEMFLDMVDGEALIYRTADGQLVRTLNAPVGARGGIRYAAWHPDGRRIALAWMTSLGLWDVETGEQLATFEGHEGMMTDLAFTGTGEWLVSTSWDHTTRLWHTDTHREVLHLPNAGNGIRLSVDGSRLAFDSWDNVRVHLYELALPRAVQRFTVPQPTSYADHFTAQAVFSPGGELVAAVDKEGVYLFQPPNPTPLAHLPADASYTVRFQPDGRALLTSGTNGVRRWPMAWSADHSELRVGPPAVLEPTRGQLVAMFELSRDGQWMVAATKKTFLGFHPGKSTEAIRADVRIQPDDRPYLSPDGRLAASRANPRAAHIQIWNPRTGLLLTNLPAHHVQEAAFSPDGRWLACAAADATTFWRTEDWSPQHRIPQSLEAPGRALVAFSPDSRVAAISVADREIRLTMVETGEELAMLPTGRLLNSLAFSPGGDRLVAVLEPGYFQLWNLRQLREELATVNLDWPDAPLPPDRSATEKLRITVILESSNPVNSLPSQAASQ